MGLWDARDGAIGTNEALDSLAPPSSNVLRAILCRRFCNIVTIVDARSGVVPGSDKAAEERVSRTRKAEVIRCHFGLIDIAVPVFSNGAHIATLFSGQVLNSPPTKRLRADRKGCAHLSHIT